MAAGLCSLRPLTAARAQHRRRWNRKTAVVYCSLDPPAIIEVAVHKGFGTRDTVPHTLTSRPSPTQQIFWQNWRLTQSQLAAARIRVPGSSSLA